MSKKLILVFVGIIFFSGFNLARADVIINEIAWKGTPSGATHEWLELANTGATADISGWTIKDGGDQLNITLPDGATIQGGGFYVIKRSTSDITPFDFSAPFSGGLSDSGEKLILADNTGANVETLDFSGGWPDPTMTSDNTMQWNGSSWITAAPTPDQANATVAIPPAVVPGDDSTTSDDSSSSSDSSVVSPTNNTSNVSISSGSSTTTKSKNVEQKIKTQITGKTLGMVGIPISLQVTTTGLSGEKLNFGKYFWNFGDGDSTETDAYVSKPFTHTYYYPGDYTVSLDYYQNSFVDIDTPDASNQITIKIIPLDVSISNVGDEKDFFVELSNNTGYNADISNWILASAQKSFTIPRGTILQAKSKIIISSRVTNFSIADKDTLKLMTSKGDTAFDYSASSTVNNSADAPHLQSRRPTSVSNESTKVISKTKSKEALAQAEIPMDSLAAASILGDTVKVNKTNNYQDKIIFIIFFVFVGASAYLAFFIRRKMFIAKSVIGGDTKLTGEDFEILDE